MKYQRLFIKSNKILIILVLIVKLFFPITSKSDIWEEVTNGITLPCSYLTNFQIKNDTLFVFASNKLYYSIDFGNNWLKVCKSDIYESIDCSGMYFLSNNYFIKNILYDYSSSNMYLLNNNCQKELLTLDTNIKTYNLHGNQLKSHLLVKDFTRNSKYIFCSVLAFNNIAGLSGHTIYRSSDEGITWERTNLINELNINDLVANDNYLLVSAEPQKLLRSNDNGETWDSLSFPFYFYPSVFGISNNIIYSGSGDLFLTSSDFGTSWEILYDSKDGYFTSTGKFSIKDSILFIPAIRIDNGIFYNLFSNDNGRSWYNFNFTNNYEITESIIFGEYLYVIDRSQGINSLYSIHRVKIKDLVNTVNVKLELNSEFILHPNPSNNIIYLPESCNFNISKCMIINECGTKVYSSIINSNSLDISFLQKGLYFVVLNENNIKQVFKFIKY
ncbi:MAG: hypothetical protein A2X64_11420 [Ignavibacteria bacterium GWF2_33_9]|nr:MAG: hypothetical protein A2X64_11420 [Ignavibacteria bacterium GWF2_33_9]